MWSPGFLEEIAIHLQHAEVAAIQIVVDAPRFGCMLKSVGITVVQDHYPEPCTDNISSTVV